MENDEKNFTAYLARLSKEMLLEHITFLREFRAQHVNNKSQTKDEQLIFIVCSRFDYIEAHFAFVSRMLMVFKDKELEQLRDQANEMLRSSKKYHLTHLGIRSEKKK